MSHAALAWAMQQDAGSMAAKLVLAVLADHAGPGAQAWPGIVRIAQEGSMDLRTARGALERLQQLGLISDTGKRRGRTGQVTIWRLEMAAPPKQDIFAAKAGHFCTRNQVMNPRRE